MGHIPKSGDVYVVRQGFDTSATMYLEKDGYSIGDRLTLVEPTGLNPFGHQSGICNWVIECKHFKPPQDESVWSYIWMLIEHGQISWEGDICEHTFDGVNVCTKCGGFREGMLFSSEVGRRVCRSYSADPRLPICTTCGFSVILHGWNDA